MVFKKKKKHPQVADPQEVRVIFSRLIDNARSLEFKLGSNGLRARLMDDDEESIFVEFSGEDREKYEIRAGQSVGMSFYYEGKEYYGSLTVMGAGKLEGKEALRFVYPLGLNINDDFGLTELNLAPRPELLYTSMFNDFCEGRLVNIGPVGADITSEMTGKIGQYLMVDKETTLGFELEPGFKISAAGRVLYINNVGEELIGVKFTNLDAETEKRLAEWIAEKQAFKKNGDRAFLKDRGVGKKPVKRQVERAGNKAPILAYDYKTVLHQGEPWILVLARDEEILQRIGKVLQRKYGVLISKGRYTNVQKIIDYYRPCLILVYETLDTISGFDLAKTISSENDGAIPLAMLGNEEDVEAKRERARSFKAVNYLPVEPFHPLGFFKKIEEMMKVIFMKMKVTQRAAAKKAAEEEAKARAGEGTAPPDTAESDPNGASSDRETDRTPETVDSSS
ncbi:MAG: PilZ domain-containing protein [Acidobacteriota bacterium]|nr:PilZ domain-containing protein [Acidobacteriota bacterium]